MANSVDPDHNDFSGDYSDPFSVFVKNFLFCQVTNLLNAATFTLPGIQIRMCN